MAAYNVYLIQTMSRSITVQAETPEELLGAIQEEMYFNVNISNNFEEDGEIDIYRVEDQDGKLIDPYDLDDN